MEPPITIPTVVRRAGLRVRRSVVGRSERRVTFAIESSRNTPIAVRVRETIPDGIDVSSIEFSAENEGVNWHVSDRGWIEFRRVLAPGDVVTTVYVVPDAIDRQRFGNVPEILAVQPVDWADLDGDGSPPWRSDGGGEPAIRTVDDGSDDERFPASGRGRVTSAATTSPYASEVLVAIPAYNEVGSIAVVVREARAYADAVLVVDDGSTDDTVVRARAAGAEVVAHERNEGYGGALKTAFEEARRRGVDHLVVLDGDGQHDPADIPQLVGHQRTENAHIVIGSRFVGEQGSSIPLYRRLGLQAINLLANVSFGTVSARLRISDTQSGFRAYDRRAIDTLAGDGAIGTGMNASLDTQDEFALVVLDSCRFDEFSRVIGNYLQGDLTKVWAAGRWTAEYAERTWNGKHNLSYINTAPVISDFYFDLRNREYRPSRHIKQLVQVWETEWDPTIGTVPADNVTDVTLATASQLGQTRVVAHYMQPHAPYIGTVNILPWETSPVTEASETQKDRGTRMEAGDGEVGARHLFEHDIDRPTQRIYKRIERGEISDAELRAAYRSNLQYVLAEVVRLVHRLNCPVVITSDHGEHLGEKGKYLHEADSTTIRQIPWFVVNPDECGLVDIESGIHGRERDEHNRETQSPALEEITTRLEQLGYVS